jgi:1-acyl-sn-glycerol-3-phosphate acyltransferase
VKLPPLPPQAPAIEGKKILRAIGRSVAEWSGWRVDALPDVAKAVVLAAPHSSNWDGLFGVCGAFGIGVRINWMGKHQLFRWPLTPILKAFGGIATDRSSAHGVVDQFAEKLRAAERMWLVLAPEGTRKKVAKWRTGFWHIAAKANVPIVPGYLHYPEKKIGFGAPIMPSSDMAADLAKLYAFYAPFRGKAGKTGLPSSIELAAQELR